MAECGRPRQRAVSLRAAVRQPDRQAALAALAEDPAEGEVLRPGLAERAELAAAEQVAGVAVAPRARPGPAVLVGARRRPGRHQPQRVRFRIG